MVNTGVSGRHHDDAPFTIGRIDQAKGYVHVLDDTTLDILLRTLDTTSDFIRYLAKKEAFLARYEVVMAEGEEELLENYLTHLNDKGEYDFVVPADCRTVFLSGANWPVFERSPQRLAQIEANEISYIWDDIIERAAYHMRKGTSVFASQPDGGADEQLLRFFARESRLHRRALAQWYVDAVLATPTNSRRIRLRPSPGPGEPYVVLVVLGVPPGRLYGDAEYRKVRAEYLRICCSVVKLLYPEALDIIGLATEARDCRRRSEDLLYFDARQWTQEMAAQAMADREALQILTSPNELRQHIYDYPVD